MVDPEAWFACCGAGGVGGTTAKRDAFAAGRVGFRPLWNLFSEKTARDRDTAEFLLETQRTFYAGMVAFLRSLGFRA